MKTIRIGMVGSGFISNIHCEAYKKIYGYEVCLRGIYSLDRTACEHLQQEFGFEQIYPSFESLLADPQIQVIDICTPPFLHLDMAKQAMQAGKHVIVEKPLTGFFGDGQQEDIGRTVDKRLMYEQVIQEMDEFAAFLATTDRKLCYAENFVYAPSVVKSKEFIEKTKSKILLMKAEESHSGSHAQHAAIWKYTGGGSFMRQGCHPLSAVIYLKMIEAKARGEVYAATSIIGDMGNTIASVAPEELTHIAARPQDVEDCANVILTFADGTKANIVSCDMVVGGTKNLVEVYTTNSVHMCNIAPNNAMRVYHADAAMVKDIYITEKLENKGGWQDVFIEEAYMRGYVSELQDFIECVDQDRQPQSGFELAYETIKLIYAAYLSAAEGRRIIL